MYKLCKWEVATAFQPSSFQAWARGIVDNWNVICIAICGWSCKNLPLPGTIHDQVISLGVLMTACYSFYKTVNWEPLTWSSLYFIQEYSAENIDWTRVDFEDNQECLDLIEKVKYYTGAWKFWSGSICLTSKCLLDTSPHLNVNTVNAWSLTNYSSPDP